MQLAYSRTLGSPFQPDSIYGLRVVDTFGGDERAVMRTDTRPWYAAGPATWSPDGTKLAFFDADSTVGGRFRLVVVEAAGGSGRTIGWIDGIPGRASWLPNEAGFVFDTTPSECPTNGGARRTYRIDAATGLIAAEALELGDASVQFGYPFVLSGDGRYSVHAGASVGNQVGVIVVTELATGGRVEVTSP